MRHSLRRIVFWQPCISPHTRDLLEAVAALNRDVDVVSCAHQGVPEERKQLGWRDKGTSLVQQRVGPQESEIEALAKAYPLDTVHILGGIRHVPTLCSAITHIRRAGAHIGLLQEPRVREGLPGVARFGHSWLTERWFRRNASFVLAIGRQGPPWFRAVGYPANRIFPFAYFIRPHEAEQTSRKDPADQCIEVGFVGRLIKMKGVEDMVRAAALATVPCTWHIMGDGKDARAFQMLAARSGGAITFHGVLDNDMIGAAMQRLDVLILPSRSESDGWGVAVSEALLQGTAVIATPKVGASIMLDHAPNGALVPPRSPLKIAEAVAELAQAGAFTASSRHTRRQNALQTLTAGAGARYLWAIVDHCFGDQPAPAPFYRLKESA